MIWTIWNLCSSLRPGTSRFQICKPTNIHWVEIKPLRMSLEIWHYFSDSMNIGLIENQKAGGDRSHKWVQSMYWPCHDMIRTVILNLSPRCQNFIVGTVVPFQHGKKPMVLCSVRQWTPPRETGLGSLVVLNPGWGLGSGSNPEQLLTLPMTDVNTQWNWTMDFIE
jgi:hypothetical protein